MRFSALIYLKAVLQAFPHSLTGSRLLGERVRQSLEVAGTGYEQREENDLIVWMCSLHWGDEGRGPGVVCEEVAESGFWFCGVRGDSIVQVTQEKGCSG